ncbi:PAAR domain-containing protein [Actibacterium sp. 188UL27-1]|uniref:PAAR domain-containing protein n=1 Tax=Actibacterium sp. 188UL27-1 TaxID=2786961 RepID=UPI001959741E|nr:PAAR domain-containing protein [Actibacterium sp. 188UL27-1]MBM7068893.1 PAAR domain-containing protein [Actibacterium sp. 188UL27-1]
MVSKPICHLGHVHACPSLVPRPHIGGPAISPGQSHVKINGIPVLVEGGVCLCTGVPTKANAQKGSSRVKINSKGIMRLGDTTSHGGKMVGCYPPITVC